MKKVRPKYCEICGFEIHQCECELPITGKDDSSKPIISRVPPEIIRAIAAVREYGSRKYNGEDNWRTVEPQRYWEAVLRNIWAAWEDYNAVDPESGLPHIDHIACNLAFILALREQKSVQSNQEIETA